MNFKAEPKYDGPSTPDSLSDQENSKQSLKDKRLSIAEELDATQNELKEAEDQLVEINKQVFSILIQDPKDSYKNLE